jgi:vanillate O-demethylase monooxygenase subunit
MAIDYPSFFEAVWLPICLSDDVHDVPLQGDLLGRKIVLWRSPEAGKLVALSDICPHRGASLSKGTVRSGDLICPYHGLVFDHLGECVDGPRFLVDRERAYFVGQIRCFEQWGIVWASAAAGKRWAAEGLVGYEHIRYVIVDEVRTNAFNIIENNFDTLHFGFVHNKTFSLSGSEIATRYSPTEDGFICDYSLPISAKGEFEAFVGQPSSAKVRCIYLAPLVQLFETTYDNGLQYSSLQAIRPITASSSMFYQVGLSRVPTSVDSDQAFLNADREIWREDKAILELLHGSYIERLIGNYDPKDVSEEHSLNLLMAIDRIHGQRRDLNN